MEEEIRKNDANTIKDNIRDQNIPAEPPKSLHNKKYNMQGDPSVLYAAGSGRKYQSDETGFIADVDDRDLGDLIKSGATKIIDQPAPDTSGDFKPAKHNAEKHQAGDELKK